MRYIFLMIFSIIVTAPAYPQHFKIGLSTMPIGYQILYSNLSEYSLIPAVFLGNQIRIPEQSLNRWFYPNLKPDYNTTIGLVFLPPRLSLIYSRKGWYIKGDFFPMYMQNKVKIYIDEEDKTTGAVNAYNIDWYTHHFVLTTRTMFGRFIYTSNNLKISMASGIGAYSRMGYSLTSWRDPEEDGNLVFDRTKGRVDNYIDYIRLSNIFESYRKNFLVWPSIIDFHFRRGINLVISYDKSLSSIGEPDSPYLNYSGIHGYLTIYFMDIKKKRKYF